MSVKMNKFKMLLEKIKKYFNMIFNNKNVKLIEADYNTNTEVLIDEVQTEEQEKNDFFDIYNNVKNGNIKITDLLINDLIKVQSMMQKEVDYFDKKIEMIEDENLKMNTEINILKNENVALAEIIKRVNQKL